MDDGNLASNVSGDGCALGVTGDEVFVAYQANGQLRGAVGNGGWVTTTIDAGDGDVGALPSLLRNRSDQWVVAYRDTGMAALNDRVQWRLGYRFARNAAG